MQYIRIDINTGAVDKDSLRGNAPSGLGDSLTVKNWRWVPVGSNVLNPWQMNGEFPTTVPTNIAVIYKDVITRDLSAWKERRIAALRAEAGKRIDAAAPQHLQLNMIARATELNTKALTNPLTQEEIAEVTALQNLWSNTINPIRQVCNSAEEAINNAGSHQDVENIFHNVNWP